MFTNKNVKSRPSIPPPVAPKSRPTIPPPRPPVAPKPRVAPKPQVATDDRDQRIQQLLQNVHALTVRNEELTAENNKLKESNLLKSDEINSWHVSVQEKFKVIASLQKKVLPTKVKISKSQQTTPTSTTVSRSTSPVPQPRTISPHRNSGQPTSMPDPSSSTNDIAGYKHRRVLVPRQTTQLKSPEPESITSPLEQVDHIGKNSVPIMPLMSVLFPPDDLWNIILWLGRSYCHWNDFEVRNTKACYFYTFCKLTILSMFYNSNHYIQNVAGHQIIFLFCMKVLHSSVIFFTALFVFFL